MKPCTVVAVLLASVAAGWLCFHFGSDPDRGRGPPVKGHSVAPLPARAPPARPDAPPPRTASKTAEPSSPAGVPEPAEVEESPEERERKATEAVLEQKVAPHAAVPKLVELLRGSDPKLRAAAVRLLGEIGPAAAPAVPALVEALQDLDLRHPAARALAGMGRAAHEALGALEACLDTPDDAFRVMVARAIWEISGVTGPTVSVLSEVLDKGPTFSPQYAAVSLGTMGADGAAGVPALVERLAREDTILQDKTQIYFGLARIGTAAAAALPYAREDLASRSLKLRSAAAHAVFRISGDVTSTLPILIDAIEQGDRHVSTWAAGNIGDLGPLAAPAIDALRRARDEGIPRIKGPAALSLYRITGDPEEALPLLVAEIESRGWFAADYAGRLGEMGRDALSAVAVLAAAAEDGNYSLQREARKALGKIRGR